jgi:hypothetical protein
MQMHCGDVGQGGSLPAMIRHYISKYRLRSQAESEWYGGQPDLTAAIRVAAGAVTEAGLMHPHQTCIRSAALSKAEHLLLAHKTTIEKCTTFDELFRLLKQLLKPVYGLGKLYIYDTSQRLGAFRGLKPERVYLHSGTRVGARRLGLDWHKDALEMSKLPAELRILSSSEAEDFLCIYKAYFGRKGKRGETDTSPISGRKRVNSHGQSSLGSLG